jgi:predicted transcriptional regulator
MESDNDRRMIHIRIDSDLHRELRKVAAEFDETIQDIAERAVEERVEILRSRMLVARERELLKKEAEYRSIEEALIRNSSGETEEMELKENGSEAVVGFSEYHDSVMRRLDTMQDTIVKLTERIQNLDGK